MRPLALTRHDFNNLLNYGDLRSSEVSVTRDSKHVDAEEYTVRLRSMSDTVTDYVSAARLRSALNGCRSFEVSIKKPYPFHEALIDDCVSLSVEQQHVYTPIAIGAVDEEVSLPARHGLPLFVRAHEGSVRTSFGDQLVRMDREASLSAVGRNLIVVYRPDPPLQREILLRLSRKFLSRHPAAGDTASFSTIDRANFELQMEQQLRKLEAAGELGDLFYETLLQLWPCGARRRLTSTILLQEDVTDVVAEMLTWNTRIRDGELLSLSGSTIDPAHQVTQKILAHGVSRKYRLARNMEVDQLVFEGVLGYRPADDWCFRGWPLMSSSRDPSVTVRTDGELRWMHHGSSGLQSIEAVADGANLAVGTSFIERTFGEAWRGKRLLFLGLGLGVLQRSLIGRAACICSIEMNPAVIELFGRLYPDALSAMDVVEGEFFASMKQATDRWDAIVIDFNDPAHIALSDAHVPQLRERLAPGGRLVINKHLPDRAFSAAVQRAAELFDLAFERFDLEMQQTVLVLQDRTGRVSSLGSASFEATTRAAAHEKIAELRAIITALRELGLIGVPHSGRSQLLHLIGTAELLLQWGCSMDLVKGGLCHNIYGTEGLAHGRALASDRARITELIGCEAEAWAHLYGVHRRESLWQNIERTHEFNVIDRHTETSIPLDFEKVSGLITLTLANWLEQMPRLPDVERYARKTEFLRARVFLPDAAFEDFSIRYGLRA